MSAAVFLCGPNETGFDNCWWCDDPLTRIKRELGEPISNEFGGRYCSQDCADRAADDRLTRQRRCTVCGGQPGSCSTDHPEDPHVYEPMAPR